LKLARIVLPAGDVAIVSAAGQDGPMTHSPRPEDLGEQRTPVAPEPPEDELSAVEPRSEPGVKGAAARFPYWFVVIGVVFAAVLVLTLVWVVFPPR
jgi:hypothetical protein